MSYKVRLNIQIHTLKFQLKKNVWRQKVIDVLVHVTDKVATNQNRLNPFNYLGTLFIPSKFKAKNNQPSSYSTIYNTIWSYFSQIFFCHESPPHIFFFLSITFSINTHVCNLKWHLISPLQANRWKLSINFPINLVKKDLIFL